MRPGRERVQRNLYVLNLPLDATTDQFEALFAQFGSVEHAVILATLDHLARRRGFILMSDPAQARAAIEHLNDHEWHHYRIEVSFAIVQRSGTPFSHECAEVPTVEERPLTASAPDAPSQSTIDRRQAPPELQASQRAGDTSLLLFELDTSVVTSSAMLRALTEPFGHIVELHLSRARHDSVTGRAMVEYCCSSSASLARLALNNLVIGGGMVQAIVTRPQLPSTSSSRDTETNKAAVPALPSGVPAYESAVDSTEHSDAIAHPLSPSGLTPRQSGRSSSGLAQAGETRGCGSRLDPWRDSSTSAPATSRDDNQDPILVDRRDRPRPIGDGRQRATSNNP